MPAPLRRFSAPAAAPHRSEGRLIGLIVLIAAIVAVSIAGFARPGLAASDFNIVVVGGPAVVSDGIMDDLDDLTTGSVTRISGSNRFATATALTSASFDPGVPVVYVANGGNFPDALAAAPVAALDGGPLLLVSTDSIPGPTASELGRLNPGKIVIVGGTAVVTPGVESALGAYTSGPVERLAGSNRFATAAAISQSAFSSGVPAAFIAVGDNFPDALAASAKAAIDGGPILLTQGTSLPAATKGELNRLNPQKIYVVGGSAVVSNGVLGELNSYTAGPVTRIAGANRFATAAAISAATFDTTTKTIYISTGLNFPDALAAGPIAGGGADNPAFGAGPILLVGDSVPSEVVAELARLGSNAAPTANAGSVTLDEDTPEAITLTGSDPDSDPLTFEIVDDPSSGALSGTPPNVTYTPDANFNGNDSFTFRVNDGSANSPKATVSITVNPVDDEPTATNDAYIAVGNTPLRLADTDPGVDGVYVSGTLLDNDTDVDGDPLSVAANSDPSNGSVTVNSDGSFEYVPDRGHKGADSFTYEMTDGTSTVQATVNITIDEMVWYYDNSAGAGGDGSLLAPYDSTFFWIEEDSSPGDTIFIYAGSGATSVAGFQVNNDQSVIGEAAGLTIGGHEIVDPGNRPDLINGISVNDNATLEGFRFSGTTNAIGQDSASITGITLRDVEIDVSVGNAVYAVDLDNAAGDLVFESDVSIKNTLFVPDPVSANGLLIGGTGNLTFEGSVERVMIQGSTGTHVFTADATIDGDVGRLFVQNSDAEVEVLGSGTFPPLNISDSDGTYTFGPGLTLRGFKVTGYGGSYAPIVNVQGPISGAGDFQGGGVQISSVGGSVTVAGEVRLGDGEACIGFSGATGTYQFNGGGSLTNCDSSGGIFVSSGTADIDFAGTWSIMGGTYGVRTHTAGGSLSLPSTTDISGASTGAIDLFGTSGSGIMIDYDGSATHGGFNNAIRVSRTDASLDMSGLLTYTGTGDAVNLFDAHGTYVFSGGGSVADSASHGFRASGSGSLDVAGSWSIAGATAGIKIDSGAFDVTIGSDVMLAMPTGRSLATGGTGVITVNAPINHPGSGWAVLLGGSPTLTFNDSITANGGAVLLDGTSGGTTTFNGALNASGTSNAIGISGNAGVGTFAFNGDVTVDGIGGTAVSVSQATSATFNNLDITTSTGSGLTVSNVALLDLDDSNTSIAVGGDRALTLTDVGIPVGGLDFDGSIGFSGSKFATAIYLSNVSGGPLTLANIAISERERGVEAYGVDELALENITFTTAYSTSTVKPLIYVGQGGDLTITGGSFASPNESSLVLQAAGGSVVISNATFTSTTGGKAVDVDISDTTSVSIADSTFTAGGGSGNILSINASGGVNAINIANSVLSGGSASIGLGMLISGSSANSYILTGNVLDGFNPAYLTSTATASVCMDAIGNSDTPAGSGSGVVNVSEISGSIAITQDSADAFNAANPGTGPSDDLTINDTGLGFDCLIAP